MSSLWKGLGLFSACSPQLCIPVEPFPSRLMLQGESRVSDLRLLGPSQPTNLLSRLVSAKFRLLWTYRG